VLKFLEVLKLLPDIGELCLQSTPHRCAWLQTASSQIQQTPNLAELESQALYPAYEGQRFDVAFTVEAEASLRSWRAWEQRIALIEPNCIGSESNPLATLPICMTTLLHSQMYTLE
jgi:hypothetical protein